MTHTRTKLSKNEIIKLGKRYLISTKYYQQLDLISIMMIYPESFEEFVGYIGDEAYKKAAGVA